MQFIPTMIWVALVATHIFLLKHRVKVRDGVFRLSHVRFIEWIEGICLFVLSCWPMMWMYVGALLYEKTFHIEHVLGIVAAYAMVAAPLVVWDYLMILFARKPANADLPFKEKTIANAVLVRWYVPVKAYIMVAPFLMIGVITCVFVFQTPYVGLCAVVLFIGLAVSYVWLKVQLARSRLSQTLSGGD